MPQLSEEQEFLAITRNHKARVERRLALVLKLKDPSCVYEPVHYAIGTGGKRVRAIITLLACEAVGGNPNSALEAAVAVELLHNFTLIHDDVMDNAALRRGTPTVYKKWDCNTAILAGDILAAHAFRFVLQTTTPRLRNVLSVFTDAFIRVCEGQGLDKDFESRREVDSKDYALMIKGKTAALISAAGEIGALIGGGTKKEVVAMRKFGEHLGMAFQIQDDLLDILGVPKEFGKKIGGDIVEGKKTYLLVKGLDRAKGADRTLLRRVVPGNGMTPSAIRRIASVYEREGVLVDARREVARYTRCAERDLRPIEPSRAKSTLLRLSRQLVVRTS